MAFYVDFLYLCFEIIAISFFLINIQLEFVCDNVVCIDHVSDGWQCGTICFSFKYLYESYVDYEFECDNCACIDHVSDRYQCGTTCFLFTYLHESCVDYAFECGDVACIVHVSDRYHCGTTCFFIYRYPSVVWVL